MFSQFYLKIFCFLSSNFTHELKKYMNFSLHSEEGGIKPTSSIHHCINHTLDIKQASDFYLTKIHK